jgi:hypothetical protein
MQLKAMWYPNKLDRRWLPDCGRRVIFKGATHCGQARMKSSSISIEKLHDPEVYIWIFCDLWYEITFMTIDR